MAPTWKRMSDKPVLSAEKPWEKVAVMCPHVLWDEQAKLFRMWYSGGEQNEPNAIGYATSSDGVSWSKRRQPHLRTSPEKRLGEAQSDGLPGDSAGEWYVMFYIGFRDE